MKTKSLLSIIAILIAGIAPTPWASAESVYVTSLAELMARAVQSGNEITMKPGTYSVRDYLTPEMLAAVGASLDNAQGKRPPNPVLSFSGNDNIFHLEGVVLEIDTRIYDDIRLDGYHRFVFVDGHRNQINGLTLRYVGPNQGTNGNALSLWGDENVLNDVTLFVHGSSPYGYGDLLGKGANPGLAPLAKQSGIMVGGDNCRLTRCRVISRAFGHCFYIQGARNTVLEDCYAEGKTRSTADMLRERGGMAEEWGYRSAYKNRDGRSMITAGYRKSLTEDGFRTYSVGGPRNQTTGPTTLVNCTAINTRAGFEIVGPAVGEAPTTLTGCTALGTERGFLLINGNIVTRRCRGDIVHGPVLYLWRGKNADVELEVVGNGSDYTVHALGTISGEGHRIKLTRWEAEGALPNLPIMLGFGMPMHAEMASTIREEAATNITLINETGCAIIKGSEVTAEIR